MTIVAAHLENKCGPACRRKQMDALLAKVKGTEPADDPEEGLGSLRMQSQQLLTESQVFQDEVLAGAESADHPPEEMPEQHVHARILSENFES